MRIDAKARLGPAERHRDAAAERLLAAAEWRGSRPVHVHVVTQVPERASLPSNLVGHAAGLRQIVRRDDANPKRAVRHLDWAAGI